MKEIKKHRELERQGIKEFERIKRCSHNGQTEINQDGSTRCGSCGAIMFDPIKKERKG